MRTPRPSALNCDRTLDSSHGAVGFRRDSDHPRGTDRDRNELRDIRVSPRMCRLLIRESCNAPFTEPPDHRVERLVKAVGGKRFAATSSGVHTSTFCAPTDTIGNIHHARTTRGSSAAPLSAIATRP
jgi:hypothetical protein